MNETIQVLMNRKSVRVFEDKEISLEIKDIILAAAMRAPTGSSPRSPALQQRLIVQI